MRDLAGYKLPDERLLLITHQGSTVFFTISDLPFNPNEVDVEGSLRDIDGNFKGNFIITKTDNSINIEYPYSATEALAPISEYISDMDIMKKIKQIKQGKYYFDIEVTENGKKYKLVVGILVVKPEQTKEITT